MDDSPNAIPAPTDWVGRLLLSISYVFAMVAGLIMTALTIMVVVSVFGRWLFSAPIFGDFEMVAIGTAVAVFLMLPYCHMKRGNVVVDLFMTWAPQKFQMFLDVLGALVLAAISILLAWRMVIGGFDMVEYNEVSYILAIPLWWAFPFGVSSFVLLAACSLYTAFMDLMGTFK